MADELLGWCVVANIAESTYSGPGGVEVSAGTRHFSPGTKVWVLPPQWGDGGEKLIVVGKHRGRPGGHDRMVVRRRDLVNFRVRAIYSPSVYDRLKQPWEASNRVQPRLWQSEQEAREVANLWSARRCSAGAEA